MKSEIEIGLVIVRMLDGKMPKIAEKKLKGEYARNPAFLDVGTSA